MGPKPTRSTQSTLDLINDEQCIVLVANLAQSLQEEGVSNAYATFALDWLNKYSTCAVSNPLLGRFKIIEGHKGHAWDERLKGFTVPVLMRERESPHRTPMETTFKGKDIDLTLAVLGSSPFTSKLKRRLVRFRARISKEDTICEGVLHQPLCQIDMWGCVE